MRPFPQLDWDSKFSIRHLHRRIDRKALNEKPHTHQWQEIIYLHKGQGKHQIDNEIIELTEKCFYLISKGQVHEFLEGENLEGYLIRYDSDFLPSISGNNYSGDIGLIFSQIWEINDINLSEKDWPQYSRLVDCIYHEYVSAPSLQKENSTIQFLFLSLMIKLMDKVRESIQLSSISRNADKNELLAFLILVNKHYSEHHELEFYLSKLKIDLRRLRRITKKYTGINPKKLVINRLMDEAKRMIQFTNNTFKEISLQLGYQDPLYFSKHFKTYTSKTPKEFRKNRYLHK